MKRVRAALAVLWILPALAQDPPPDLKTCGALDDPIQRLACYDHLAGRAAAPSTDQNFGLHKPAEQPLDRIRSRLVGEFRGWEKGQRFTLENDQVWKCADDHSAFYSGIPANPAVTIEKSFFGAYWMAVEGVSRKIKVSRVK